MLTLLSNKRQLFHFVTANFIGLSHKNKNYIKRQLYLQLSITFFYSPGIIVNIFVFIVADKCGGSTTH